MDGGKDGCQAGHTRHWAEEMPGKVLKLVGTGNSPLAA